jgi:hypothetical protein
MGLERMLLAWVSVSSFICMTSLTLKGAFRFVFLPFAVVGVLFAVYRYFVRLRTLYMLHQQREQAVGIDLWAYHFMVITLVLVIASAVTLNYVE